MADFNHWSFKSLRGPNPSSTFAVAKPLRYVSSLLQSRVPGYRPVCNRSWIHWSLGTSSTNIKRQWIRSLPCQQKVNPLGLDGTWWCMVASNVPATTVVVRTGQRYTINVTTWIYSILAWLCEFVDCEVSLRTLWSSKDHCRFSRRQMLSRRAWRCWLIECQWWFVVLCLVVDRCSLQMCLSLNLDTI